jgi:hypothetical protein
MSQAFSPRAFLTAASKNSSKNSSFSLFAALPPRAYARRAVRASPFELSLEGE